MNKREQEIISLLPHNQKTYNDIVEIFKTENRVCVIQPTGTGKTFLLLKWIEDNQGSDIIFLAPSTEIFEQTKRHVVETSLLERVQMITYQELLQKSEDEIKALRVDKVIIDEFHRIGAEQWGPAVQTLLDSHDVRVLGLTATPIRYLDNARDMSDEVFDGNIARYMTLGEAVHDGILPTPVYVPVYYDFDNMVSECRKSINNISDKDKQRELADKLQRAKAHLEKAYNAEDIFAKYLVGSNEHYIVFCKSVEHISEVKELLKQWLQKVNANLRFYISIKGKAYQINQLNEFSNDQSENTIKFLLTVDRLNEGVHVPSIDGVIMLRPTTSPTIYLQQMGRALACGNKSPLIFDMVNNYHNVQIKLNNGESKNVFEREFRDSASEMKESDTFKILEDARKLTEILEMIQGILYINNNGVWNQNFELLKEFVSEFGRFPSSNEIYKGASIGIWCRSQKKNYKLGKLSQERVDLLKSIGFEFGDLLEGLWNQNFELSKEFKLEFGRFPKCNEIYKEANIGEWCRRQKKNYKLGKLSQERIDLLKSIGFQFGALYEEAWNQKFELLKEFVSEFSRFPRQKEEYKGVKIGRWCDNQKANYKAGELSQERIALLKSIGFEFGDTSAIECKTLNAFD